MIEIVAYFSTNTGKVDFASVTYNLTDEEAALYPKYMKLRATGGKTFQDMIRLSSDMANGGVNEAGISRINRLLARGAVYNVAHPAVNVYRTLEDFLAALNA